MTTQAQMTENLFRNWKYIEKIVRKIKERKTMVGMSFNEWCEKRGVWPRLTHEEIWETAQMEKCDCVTNCGDDSRVERGEVEPCNIIKARAKEILMDESSKMIVKAAIKWRKQKNRNPAEMLKQSGMLEQLKKEIDRYIKVFKP
ncbi:MAG: hypothetical protein V3U02_09210 [Calditrichia bacterium]